MTTDSFEALRIRAELARKEAKSIRLQWKNRVASDERNAAFQCAINGLDEVIADLGEWREEQSAFRKEAEREVGDCLGGKGGTYRDWEKYDKAAEAYDQGLVHEKNVYKMGGQPNSYCLVQRLVARVLANPEAFCRSEEIIGCNVQTELEKSIVELRDQMRVLRSSDPWAQADLALLLQLLGDKADKTYGDDAALTAWDKLDNMRPDRFLYESTFEVVKLIKEKLEPYLCDKARDSWEDLLNRLS